MSQTEFLEALPEAQRKHLDPASPMPMRMMAAKGMAPLPPREMLITLCGLRIDEDAKIANAADATVRNLPDKLLGPALDGDLPRPVAAALPDILNGREAMLEKLVLNRNVADDVVAAVAADAPEPIAEIIASNQERCLRSRAIVGEIRKNRSILKSSLERLFDFLVRSGVIYEGMPEFEAAMGRLSPAQLQQVAEVLGVPDEVGHLVSDSAESDARAELAEEELERKKNEEQDVQERIPMLKLINSLNVAQKIALAVKGNKEARTILVRDSNRLVATATIRNPRITEPEVLSAAKSRSVGDDVIRIIAHSKEMTRKYAVKRALVENPKTPVQVALRMLGLLREADIRSVAKSRNVPTAVANQAKRLMQKRKR